MKIESRRAARRHPKGHPALAAALVVGASVTLLAARAPQHGVGSERIEDVITFESQEGELDVTVNVNGELFTRLLANQFKKPVWYPIMAAGNVPMTRSWPIESESLHEKDHPHHKSLWFAHGDVNGVDFWTEKGTITTTKVHLDSEAKSIELENEWMRGDQPMGRDLTRVTFGASDGLRWIDFDTTIEAAYGPLRFSDTKEGTMAIRTHPHLRLTADASQDVDEVFGSAVNSQGQTGKEIWGKRAQWVFYSGRIEGHSVGLLIMDHPQNLRHPTTWHARDYGLIAANPFGLHDFLGAEKGAGDYELAAGNRLRLRYRFVFVSPNDASFDPHAQFSEFGNSETSSPSLKSLNSSVSSSR